MQDLFYKFMQLKIQCRFEKFEDMLTLLLSFPVLAEASEAAVYALSILL